MTPLSPAAILRGLGVVALAVAWAVLAHVGSTADQGSDFAATMAIAPMLAIVVMLLWRFGTLAMVLGGLAALGVISLFWPDLRQNISRLYFIQHLGTNLALALLFGRSMLAGQQPIITRLALLAHAGVLSVAQERYTRQVTVAWALFFLGCAIVSVLLYFFAPASAWSVFANLLSAPLIGLMFLLEHICRHTVLPPEDRTTIADTIRGIREGRQRPAAHPESQP